MIASTTFENEYRVSVWLYTPLEVSVLPGLALGHLDYGLTGVQPQADSSADVVLIMIHDQVY